MLRASKACSRSLLLVSSSPHCLDCIFSCCSHATFHFDQFGRLLSTDFRGKPIPPYAILSHRWEESEILFEDIASETYKEKKDGYRKLMFCAKQAAQDQLQYFWIDTCCIKRWDRLERSRAINSMFRWYSEAKNVMCFYRMYPMKRIQYRAATGRHPSGQASGSLEAGHSKN